ncbi:hypothetical protein Q5752_000586 [Cryptotrichosporon argae]
MDVERLVRTRVTSDELEPPAELVSSVNAGQTPLLGIVKALGEYLTSTEDAVRLKGLTFLTNVIKTIDPTKVNGPASRTLTTFYVSKLDDFESLAPSLSALLVLSKQPTFDDTAAVEAYRTTVETINMKAYVQSTRYLVYQLLDSFLALHRKAFKELGADFINSYTKMVDGEKDPRNLMLLFSIDRVILLEFDVVPHIDALFDIIFCYFPITFRPPPNDPYGITADDLKLALRECMAASPHFARMAIPLFLEKLTTATGQMMKDLLQTMAACFPVYGANAVRERGPELWEAIKTEILYSSDLAIEAASLSALKALVRTLYLTKDDVATGLAQDIIKQCLEILDEPEKSQGVAATKALAALVLASASAGTFALSQALPQLFTQFNRPTLPSHRAPILGSISTLLVAARSVYAAPGATRTQQDERSLEPYRDALLDVLREGLRTDGLKIAATNGSVALIEIPGFWTRKEVEDIVRGLNEILVHDLDEDVKSNVISALTTISTLHAAVVESVTLPLLFHTLPDVAPGAKDYDGRERYRDVLSSLSALCAQPALFENLVVRLSTKLDLLGEPTDVPMDGSTGAETRECTVAYAWDLLRCLESVVGAKLDKKHTDVTRYFDKIVPRLYGLAVGAALPRADKVVPLFRDRRLLSAIGSIAERLVWELDAERQARLFAMAYAAFEAGELAGIVHHPASVKVAGPSAPLRTGATAPEQDLVVVYSTLMQGLKAEVALPFPSAPDFLVQKVHWAIKVARDDFQLQAMLDLITAFVNKRSSDLKDALDGLLERIWMVDIQDTTQEPEIRRRALLVYQHIVKALALLRNELAYTATDRIIDVLALSAFDPLFVDEAGRCFGVLATKGKAHLTARLLHAQKLWNHVLPKLIEGDKEAEAKGKVAYLVAFASLLPLVPASLCLSDLPALLPLLLRSLSLARPKQRTNVITALTAVLETDNYSTEVDVLLHARAEDVVDGVLRSAFVEDGIETSANVRMAALGCLRTIPDAIRYETLGRHKARVIRELGQALDDPLRSVRREAVDCRARWYRYGSSV